MVARYRQFVAVSILMLTGACLPAAAAVPGFIVEDLGTGVPVDINARGTVIGQDGFTPDRPWVLTEQGKVYLPLPAGVTAAKVNRINDEGVVVGEAGGLPLVWWPSAGGYELEQLPLAAGATSGTAVDANSSGEVLLSYGTPGTLATGYQYVEHTPYLFSVQGTLIDLSAHYALPPYPYPVDLTDDGRILLESGEILEPTGVVTPAPPFPDSDGGYSWIFFRASRINESGAFIGVATLSSSMSYAQAVKYTPGSGWKILGGLSLNVTANGIDTAGNALAFANYVCAGNFGLVYAPSAGGSYCLDDLIIDGGWSFLGFSAKGALASGEMLTEETVAPAGVMAAYGYSYASGESRLVLIIPDGDLPPPPAASVQAVSRTATWSQPYDSIRLSWPSVGHLAKAYVIERKGPGEAAFTEIAEVSANTSSYDDTSVTPLATYSYRIAAIGLAGSGPYSNVVSAQAPAGMDSKAPLAIINTPGNGATVSGTVSVSATFTDNVGLVYASLTFAPTASSELICEKTPESPAPSLALECNWDTARVGYQAPSATVYAYGHDALGNWVRTSVTVNVTYPTSTETSPTKDPGSTRPSKGGGKPGKK